MAYHNTNSAQIVNDQPAPDAKPAGKFDALAQWVVEKTDAWRTWRDSNYSADWDAYERLWRGKWGSQEQHRASERSKIVTPALSEAVENGAAEIEEAVFGRGSDYFDIETDEEAFEEPSEAPQPNMGPMGPNMGMPGAPPMPMAPMAQAVQRTMDPAEAVERTRNALREDLQRSDFASNCTEVILHSAVFGTGFAEIVTVEKVLKRPTADGIGSTEETFDMPTLRAVSPRNVLVDPNAKRLEEGLGIAIEEEVSRHLLLQQQKAGDLDADVDLKAQPQEMSDDLSGDMEAKSRYDRDKVHVIRWYGLVPTKLLFPENHKKDEGTYLSCEEAEDGDYTEAIIVLVNKRDVAKAVTNPAPKGDRPIAYFPWDVVPGRLHGRGLCEKGYNAQKILDTEVRARLDGLALTWAPMVGIDATRVPRGAKFTIQPGQSIFTNGDPDSVIRPMKFGQLDPNHWQNAQALQAMVAQATGSVDATQLANNVGQARSGAVSMAMAPVIKRYKRTLVRFFDLFLMPALDKIVSRSQQAMPERYPAVGVRMRPASTMGIMQREYETSQLTSLLQSLQPGTPEHRAILMGIVSNTSIPNRETVLKLIAGAEAREAQMAQAMAAQQQNPQMQAAQAQLVQLEMAERGAKVQKLQADAQLSQAKAVETAQAAELEALQIATKGMYAVPAEQQAAEFDRRVAIAQQALEGEKIREKARDRESNERIALAQMTMSAREKERDRQHKTRVEIVKLHAKSQPKAQPGGNQ